MTTAKQTFNPTAERVCDLIAEARALAAEVHDYSTRGAEVMNEAADALEDATAEIARLHGIESLAMGETDRADVAEARLAALTTPQEGDARERLHAKCDCVPDLGPAHCHLCGNAKGSPVPWPECSAVRAAAPARVHYEYGYGRAGRNHPIIVSSRRYAEGMVDRWGHAGTRLWRRTQKRNGAWPAGPWEPLPVGGENDGE